MKKIIKKKFPFVFNIAKSIVFPLKNILFPGSKVYWEKNYSTGGNSGEGSYGKFAEFKAEIINSFVNNNKINSVIEFGCGDGNQLSYFKFPSYIGMDVSSSAVNLCKKKFSDDNGKQFFSYNPESFDVNNAEFKSDLALSLDVIYHLIEDNIFEIYMKHLFASANKFVIIYSSNTNYIFKSPHNKSREFSNYIEKNLQDWLLIEKIKNRYPNESISDFFIYKKIK